MIIAMTTRSVDSTHCSPVYWLV